MFEILYFGWAGYGFIVLALILSMASQFYVQSNYNKYSKVSTLSNRTGADIARLILEMNNITDVQVVQSNKGTLSDHYDPTKKIVALSPKVYSDNSIASVAVAAHEVGHAIQHAQAYGFIALRNKILPLAIVGGNLSTFAIMIGLIGTTSNGGPNAFFYFGIACLAAIALFQLVTLPVEFDASKRALKILDENQLLTDGEMASARKMLTAAALTYVAALMSTIFTILRYLAISNSRKRD